MLLKQEKDNELHEHLVQKNNKRSNKINLREREEMLNKIQI